MYCTVEFFARKFNSIHPKVKDFLSEFFSKNVLDDIVIKIMKKENIWSGRAKKNQNLTSPSKTPAFVLLNRMYFGNGVLNKPGYHTNNTFDLSTPEGMATFMHEVFHVYQWKRDGILFIFKYLKAVLLSLFRSRIFWDHKVIDFEIEAIKFERKMRKKLSTEPYISKIKIFKSI